MPAPSATRFDGKDCTLTIDRRSPAVVVITFAGNDVGEFGDAPFRELEKSFPAPSPIELFIDARQAKGASLDVSGEWARWLRAHKVQFRLVSMLTGSRFIQLSAEFVRRFAELGEQMRVYLDPAAFEQALKESLQD